MPNFLTHLAVAKRYAEKNNITGDKAREFFHGTVYPDLEGAKPGADKEDTHYKMPLLPEQRKIERFFIDRVDYKKFFKQHKGQTPFERGVLLHLIVDNDCYPTIIDRWRFTALVEDGVRPGDILANSFNSVNNYLKQKYGVNLDMTGVKKEIENCETKWINQFGTCTSEYNFFDTQESLEKLDLFIEKASSVDLDAFIQKHR
ncbi:MAG: hypothetical protein FWC00_03060 [Firmicutes bacterium]|nr:hypothetical protein [Bacillota bacterium]